MEEQQPDYILSELQLSLGLLIIDDEIKSNWDILKFDWHRNYAHQQIVHKYILPRVPIPEMVIEDLKQLDNKLDAYGYPMEYQRYYQEESDESICFQLERLRGYWWTRREIKEKSWYRQYLRVQLDRRFVEKNRPLPAHTLGILKLTDAKLEEMQFESEFSKYYVEE
jgi:hypothetical protein